MNRKYMKSAVLFLLIASIMLTVAGAVSTKVTASWDEKGCDISITSTCNESSSSTGIFAGGVVASSKTMRADELGGYVELYNSSNKLIERTGLFTNSSSGKSINFITDAYDITGKYYGIAHASCYDFAGVCDEPEFNVSGKKTSLVTYTASSRMVEEADAAEEIAVEELSISLNENGETYGCMIASLEQDIELDLIAAVGNNGVEGYVRSAEMDAATYRAPEERHIVQTEDVTIPLYDVDGVTIIDTFTITAPNGVTYE